MRDDDLTHPWAHGVKAAIRLAYAWALVGISPCLALATSLIDEVPLDSYVITDELESTPDYQSALRQAGMAVTGRPEIVTEGRRGAQAFVDLEKRVRLNDFAGLAQDAHTVLVRIPKSGLAYELIGIGHFLATRYDKAETAFKSALRVESGQSGRRAAHDRLH